MGLWVYVIVLGMVAAVLDVGSRWFGSTGRTPGQAVVRILVLLGGSLLLGSPLLLLAADPASALGRRLLAPFGVANLLIVLHYLVPYRWGIERLVPPGAVETVTPLAEGVVLRRVGVSWDSLSEAGQLPSLSLLVISDLHCDSAQQLALVEECCANVVSSTEAVDVVAIVGDFGRNVELLPALVAALGRIPSRYGAFCVRGNHDFEESRATLLHELLEKAGVQVLSDSAHHLAEAGVTLVGLEGPWKSGVWSQGTGMLGRERSESLVVGLSHTPDNIAAFRRMGAHLVFAGHTHGGRLRVPVLGALTVPSRYGRFLDRGWFRFGDTVLHIVSGIGYCPGLLGATGEILHLTVDGEASPRRAPGRETSTAGPGADCGDRT